MVMLLALFVVTPCFAEQKFHFMYYFPKKYTTTPCFSGYKKWISRFQKQGCWYSHREDELKIYTCPQMQIITSNDRAACIQECKLIHAWNRHARLRCEQVHQAGQHALKYLGLKYDGVKW